MFAVRALKIAACLSLLAPMAAAAQSAPTDTAGAPSLSSQSNYRIGPGDQLQIFVWKNPDLSTSTPVRPDGKISAPLVQDVQAQGRTPTELAAALKAALSTYIQEPVVTVLVTQFSAPTNSAAIRVIGSAAAAKTIPYRSGITALDVMVDIGGLETFASGNRAQLLRQVNGKYVAYPLRLADLVKAGDLKANVELQPGDIIRIPQRAF
jgi:polysaccharide export outer membrane protein